MSGEKEAYDELLGSISTTEDQGQDAPESLMDQALNGSKDNSDIIRKAHKNDIDEDDPVWILVKAYQDAADFQNQTAAMLDKIRCAAKDDARISIENAAHEAFASGTKALHRMLEKERVAMMSDIQKASASVKVQGGGGRGMLSIMVAACVGVAVGVGLAIASPVLLVDGDTYSMTGKPILNSGKTYIEIIKQ